MRDFDEDMNRLTEGVIGAAIEVHRTLGPGFLESSYEKVLCIEMGLRGIEHVVQHPVALKYKEHQIGEGRLDLLVDRKLVVELKAIDKLAPIHHAQVISYLKATKLEVGLLMNFNVEVLRDGIKRIVLTQ